MKFRSDCIIMYLLQEECDLMDTLYLAAVCAVVPGLGRSRIPDLINALGSARAVFEASAATYGNRTLYAASSAKLYQQP